MIKALSETQNPITSHSRQKLLSKQTEQELIVLLGFLLIQLFLVGLIVALAWFSGIPVLIFWQMKKRG